MNKICVSPQASRNKMIGIIPIVIDDIWSLYFGGHAPGFMPPIEAIDNHT